MKIIAVIPARFASTRFPGKPLQLLKGKPVLQWTVEGARKSTLVQEIYVATDDERIADLCRQIRVNVVMTSTDCETGTDRIFQATRNLEFDAVLNIQGDEPLIDEGFIDPLARVFLENKNTDMATLAHSLTTEDLNNKNAVKVILNHNQEAIYFSRFPVPYSRESFASSAYVLKHIGLYGYTRAFLGRFCATAPVLIEKCESLEQLRALHLGAKIKVISVAKPTFGVDTPEDLEKLQQLL